ncbi:hypothetical protein R1sor_000046 [Riccia sorocarpa]|uniref:PsbP C-terminal domain-containing protein n=1 Tax=Riccia sorocarpa TaxID=122646 RepID=A0ABD3GY27_9MARC
MATTFAATTLLSSSACSLCSAHLIPSGASGDAIASSASVGSGLRELKRELRCVGSQEQGGLSNFSLHYSRPWRAVTTASSSMDSEEKSLTRREVLSSSAAILAAVAFPCNSHGLSRVYDVSEDSSAGSSETVSPAPSKGVVQSVDDVSTWYRFRGEGFALRIPPGYQDVLDPLDEEALNSLYGERAKDRPFAARFASPDGDEVLSVVIKPASQMRLSFFEAMDVKDFGTIREAAPKFVPGGAKLVAAKIINSTKSRVPRTYYMYEFLAKDKHVALSAGVAGGRVFVLGATVPESKWKEAGDKMRSAALSFYLP